MTNRDFKMQRLRNTTTDAFRKWTGTRQRDRFLLSYHRSSLPATVRNYCVFCSQVRSRGYTVYFRLFANRKPTINYFCVPWLFLPSFCYSSENFAEFRDFIKRNSNLVSEAGWHVETFSWNLCATMMRKKFHQVLRRVTWSVSWNFFEFLLRDRFHEK